MTIKRIYIDEILDFLGDKVLSVEGYNNRNKRTIYIDNLADVTHVNETSLDWINPRKEKKQEIAEVSKARVLLVDESISPIEGKVLIRVNTPKMVLAQIGNHFFVDKPVPGIHPTAIVHPEAKIGENVSLGAYTVVGKATIGDNCEIESNVKIYDCVVMGHDCVIKSGAVIGGAGFGFERDAEGNKFRFPQIGGLIIGDYVEVGANTCIDRGALSNTIIGDYTKINNLCHIAHNNIIGKNVTITGCVNVSGGNIIDDDVWIAPNSSLRGYIHLGKGCTLGMGAVATKDIPAGEVWVGNPAKKLEKNK